MLWGGSGICKVLVTVIDEDDDNVGRADMLDSTAASGEQDDEEETASEDEDVEEEEDGDGDVIGPAGECGYADDASDRAEKVDKWLDWTL